MKWSVTSDGSNAETNNLNKANSVTGKIMTKKMKKDRIEQTNSIKSVYLKTGFEKSDSSTIVTAEKNSIKTPRVF